MGDFDNLPKEIREALADSKAGVSTLVAIRLLRRMSVEKALAAIALADQHLCGIGGAA